MCYFSVKGKSQKNDKKPTIIDDSKSVTVE